MVTETLRLLKFGKFGLLEDPAGLIVLTPGGDLRFVDSVYRREFPAALMLRVRAFNGERCADIGASSVRVVGPSGMFATGRYADTSK